MTRENRATRQVQTVLFLFITACTVRAATPRGQAMGSPVASGNADKSASNAAATEPLEFVKRFSEFVVQRLASSNPLSYLGKGDLSDLRADMERFVRNRLPPRLSQGQITTIHEGTALFIERSLAEASRGDFPNVWENLKWRVAGVLLAAPLNKEEQARLSEQLAYVSRYVRDNGAVFAQMPRRTPADSVRLLDSFCADPFLPCFKKPFGQAEWRKYCKVLTRTANDFAKLPADAAKPDVLEIIIGAMTVVRPPTKRIPRRIEITPEGPLVDFAPHRSPYTLGCFAYENPGSMSRTTVIISEPAALDIGGADRVSDHRDRRGYTMTIEEATALAKRLKGDFLYSDRSNELIGVKGTEFALIDKNSASECFSLSDKVIRVILNATGKPRFSLREYKDKSRVFKSDAFVPGSGPLPEPPRGLFVAVCDHKGCMGILHIQAIWSMDSNTGRERGAGIGADFYKCPLATWGLDESDYSPDGDMRQWRAEGPGGHGPTRHDDRRSGKENRVE